MKLVFEATIPGRPAIKKNTQRVVRRGGRTRAIYSKSFQRWEDAAYFHFKRTLMWEGAPLTGELSAEYVFHFKNHQWEGDVSNFIEAPQDFLQDVGVIENDKQIMSLTARKVFDGTESTEIKLYEI